MLKVFKAAIFFMQQSLYKYIYSKRMLSDARLFTLVNILRGAGRFQFWVTKASKGDWACVRHQGVSNMMSRRIRN